MDLFYLNCLCLLWLPFSTGQWPLNASVSSKLLETRLTEMMTSSLRHDDMQAYYDTLQFGDREVDGESILDQLSAQIGTRFAERVDTLRTLQQRSISASNNVVYKICCELQESDIFFDPRFSQKVTRDEFCLRVSCSSPANYSVLSDAFREQCVQNLNRLPLLKWQYYGTEEGVTSQFPGLPIGDCNDCTFDNRERPWYVQAKIARPQEVVIVIDQSSQTIDNFDLAKQVATILVDSSSPRDKIVAIGFYDSVTKPNTSLDNCFLSSLAQAVTSNKRNLNDDFIKRLSQQRGNANYNMALKAAFDYFNPSTADTDAVIAFISSSLPSDNEAAIFQTLVDENSRLNDRVYIMTIGIGSNTNVEILRKMASQDGSTYGVGKRTDVKEGAFFQIDDQANLRHQMSSYFRHFSPRSNTANNIPQWTVPYLDSWGLGVVISGTLPVDSSGELIGVVAVDVTLDELLAESTFFGLTEFSYSFIIDQDGLIINHPLFPYVDDTQPLFVEATAYERDPEFQQILRKMLSKVPGQQEILATRVLPGGYGKEYGIRTVKIRSTYYWKEIPNTRFIMCLVIPTDEREISNPQVSFNPSFLYHRFDIARPPQACSHFDTYFSTRNRSSVAFGARCYLNPEEYLLQAENEESVTTLQRYMEGLGRKPDNLRNEIRTVVALTHRAEALWASVDQQQVLQQKILFRYLGTREGVFRSFPGSQVPQNFDPVTRPWYVQALAHRGRISVTTPYRDINLASTIVTLSKVLYAGRSSGNHTSSDSVVGVMGMDVALEELHTIILDLYPICKQDAMYKCLLVDQSGYTIWSDRLMNSQDVLRLPLPEVENEIASYLLRENLMVAQSCAILNDISIFHSYKIIAQTRHNGVTGGGIDRSCFNFSLFPIHGTNTFLIVSGEPTASNSGNCTSSPKNCLCPKLTDDRCPPSSNGANDCECPCKTTNSKYNPCTNTYEVSNQSSYPCIVDSRSALSSLPTLSLEGLQSCSSGPSSELSSDGISVGIIVAIVLCALLSIMFIVVAIYIYKTRTKSVKQNPPSLPQRRQPSASHILPDGEGDYMKPDLPATRNYEEYEGPAGEDMMN